MQTAKIIVLAGQSNAVGVGHQCYLPQHFSEEKVAEFRNGYENVLIHYFSQDIRNEGFEKTTLGMAEKHLVTFGPEVGIAEYLNRCYPNETFYIVKTAVGGTGLHNDWLPPSCEGHDSDAYDEAEGEHRRANGWCYNELVRLLREGIRLLEEKGLKPQIRAFCWMQGENDACEKDTTDKYGERYEQMLCDLRKEFGGYMSRCTFVDAGVSDKWTFYREVNEAKRQHALRADDSVYIDTIAEGLVTDKEPVPENDWAHYDSDCTVKLGQLFAAAIPLSDD